VHDKQRSGSLVSRRVRKATAPRHVEYALTPLGQTLEAPLAAICAWAVAGDTDPGAPGE
jgi:DNA-binding HxlR family transcriptional regulator